MFGLLVKVGGSSVVDAGSIPDSLQLRQKCVVGQPIANSANCKFFNFNFKKKHPSFNRTYLTASFHCFRVLAKAIECKSTHKML